ncbi:uncharacterized protein LOC105202530 [Solenopsis invicta]|uniref:uncharacterized protein LOC105202530 n=1 Tax=Solenopsis invicta TaxID=13686 RepID=UPI000595EBC4|nr:uncharacterized protein LOC105202530 [Solenopsis invicta]XP_039314905.1 uncharacterized protein LOC105202530 [Solenopsis invicta]XP_039314906.1 uncharacterized protein LOC105202530 [Solenopsis invicta]
MPGCAAVGCNNRSEKGYIMKCFPRDPNLRKIWQDRVARADWEPSNNSFLCHVHFEPEEWSITQNGRLRLRKNAIPSIFTVTSTRKSARKRNKLTNVKSENECENDYMTESLENDTEYSSISHLEEKDSDLQDVDNPAIWSLVYQPTNQSPKKMEIKQPSDTHYIDITDDLQQENIIIISDDNSMKIESNTKENDVFEKQASTDNKKSISNFVTKRNSPSNQNENIAVKTEIKLDVDQIFNDSYDEIEEKLKQICDDHREENNTEKLNPISRNRKETFDKSITQLPFHKSINYKYSSRHEIGDMLIDNRDNIEIIFGSESGEEFARVPRYTFYNSETNEIDKRTPNVNNITDDKEINETFPEHIEEAFSGEDIHIVSNMRTVVKCKRKIREEVMRSIKRSVQDASFRDTNSVSNSDASDIMENKVKKELNLSEISQYSNNDAVSDAKFIVKVTGDREDVFDIMHDLFKDTKDFTIQEHKNTCLQQENNVTSIITIDDCSMETDSIDKSNIDIFSTLSTLKNECLSTRLLSSDVDMDEDMNRNKNLDMNNTIINGVTEQSMTNNISKCEHEKLQRKVKLQETVIRQLTNQLILLKDLEKKLQDKNVMLKAKTKEIEKKMNELNNSTDDTPLSINYKQMDMKQRLIYDLSNRMNNLEEMNKKLMKTITIECQQKRQLENQVKQRDKQIKELNWKLEKASKYLERAEKNTNTYKRKMLNMQTFIRRKKLLDENTSRFHEIIIDSMKENYSEKVLAMAIEIQEICGTNGYKKLLNYGFPLPALSVLQAPLSDCISDSRKNNKIQGTITLKQNTNEERDIQFIENDMKVNEKNHVENITSLCEEVAMDDTETVTGTVQDIFEENDDIDDFSTNELREHFILQLNEVI